MMAIKLEIPMHAHSILSTRIKHRSAPARVVKIGTCSLFGLFRTLWRGESSMAKSELRDDNAMLRDARRSMICGNHARSWRVLSEWLKSRGEQTADYEWLSVNMLDWEDGWVISRLSEARVARLLVLKRTSEVLTVALQRLSVDSQFRPSSAADTLTLAQIAARGGAQRISRTLLSDFSFRFPGDPRVSISEALLRRLSHPSSG
jgi:hypothetical protein